MKAFSQFTDVTLLTVRKPLCVPGETFLPGVADLITGTLSEIEKVNNIVELCKSMHCFCHTLPFFSSYKTCKYLKKRILAWDRKPDRCSFCSILSSFSSLLWWRWNWATSKALIPSPVVTNSGWRLKEWDRKCRWLEWVFTTGQLSSPLKKFVRDSE